MLLLTQILTNCLSFSQWNVHGMESPVSRLAIHTLDLNFQPHDTCCICCENYIKNQKNMAIVLQRDYKTLIKIVTQQRCSTIIAEWSRWGRSLWNYKHYQHILNLSKIYGRLRASSTGSIWFVSLLIWNSQWCFKAIQSNSVWLNISKT